MMSDHTTHEPFDDELLSAYLDDELSPDERAQVEARLAADPAARQLLEQLRSVSQAVQELPRESLGEDLRAAILQRAQANKVETDAVLPWPRPQLSAGRTRRAWMWTGLAVAAALLIMVFQPNAEDEDGIPGVVAMRGAAEEAAPERSLDLRSGGEVIGPEREFPSTSSDGFGGGGAGGVVAQSAPPATVLEDGTVAGDAAIATDSSAPLAASQAPASSMELSRRSELAEGLVLSAPAGGGRSASGETSMGRFVEEHDEARSESVAAADEDLLVVHVQLTPVAFQNKVFDSTLVRCGIAVEGAPAAAATEPLAGRSMDRAATSRQLSDQAQSAPPVDVVLVDAPVAQVEQALNELDRDTANYLAVDIEGQPSRANLLKDKATQADQWKQYNRGIVPAEQKALSNSNVLSATQQGQAANSFGADLYRARGQENLAEARRNIKNYAQQSRAMRVPLDSQAVASPAPEQQLYGMKSEMPVAPASPDSATLEAESSGSAAQKLAKSTDNIQVLFFLCPEHVPASSPPADNRVP
jgi:anti-sigma factor RsiW